MKNRNRQRENRRAKYQNYPKEERREMKTYKRYFPSVMFSGEIILRGDSYATFEEAKSNTDLVYPDVEWEEYNEKGVFINSSYDA